MEKKDIAWYDYYTDEQASWIKSIWLDLLYGKWMRKYFETARERLRNNQLNKWASEFDKLWPGLDTDGTSYEWLRYVQVKADETVKSIHGHGIRMKFRCHNGWGLPGYLAGVVRGGYYGCIFYDGKSSFD